MPTMKEVYEEANKVLAKNAENIKALDVAMKDIDIAYDVCKDILQEMKKPNIGFDYDMGYRIYSSMEIRIVTGKNIDKDKIQELMDKFSPTKVRILSISDVGNNTYFVHLEII